MEADHDTGFLRRTSQKYLYLGITLLGVDGTHGSCHLATGKAADPDVDAGAVSGGASLQIPIVQGIDHLGIAWVM